MDFIIWLKEQISSNAFFNGVIGASLITGATLWFKQIFNTGKALCIRYFTTSFSVTNENEELFSFVNSWLKSEGIHKSPRRVVILRGEGSLSHGLSAITTDSYRPNLRLLDHIDRKAKEEGTTFDEYEKRFMDQHTNTVSNDDYYYSIYKGRPMKVMFESKQREMTNILRTVTITFYFRGSKWVNALASEFRNVAYKSSLDKTHITVRSHVSGWRYNKGEMLFRQMDSMLLPDDQKQLIINDLEKFARARSVYASIGKPYHRNYLFYGPPGTGKTSLVWVLATLTKRDVFAFTDLSNKSWIDMMTEIGTRPEGVIVLFEDVDRIGMDTSEEGTKMSSFMSVLDGSMAIDNCIFVLTTNHPEKVDPVLFRPGRVDVKLLLDKVDVELATKYLMAKANLDEETAISLLQPIVDENNKVLPASVQEILQQKLT